MDSLNIVKISNNKNIEDKHKISDYERKRIKTGRNVVSSSFDNQNKKKCKTKIKIIISISSVCLIAILIAVVLFMFKYWKKDNSTKYYTINVNEYKKELAFKNKVNDIRRIAIQQKINENMIIKGIEVPTKYLRKIEYDIYIISEKSADEKNKGSYNKIYTASISMARQCLSKENEECELKDFVNLLNNNKTNLSSLKEIDDLIYCDLFFLILFYLNFYCKITKRFPCTFMPS